MIERAALIAAVFLALFQAASPLRAQPGEPAATVAAQDLEAATAQARKALSAAERKYGRTGRELAEPLGNLIALYQKQQRFGDAVPLLKRLLGIGETVNGRDHPSIVPTLVNLATVYRRLGRYADAHSSARRALDIRERTLGADDPAIAESLDLLGAICIDETRYGDAEKLYGRALTINRKAFGADHAEVGWMLSKLGETYARLGRNEEAEKDLKDGLAILEKALGSDHAYVASVLAPLASFYIAQGRYSEAEPVARHELAIHERVLGPDHPETAKSLERLGIIYAERERFEEARGLFERALAIKERVLGPDHPEVAIGLTNLAGLYSDLQRYGEAAKLQERALGINERAFGQNSSAVAGSLRELGTIYITMRDFAKAEPFLRRAIKTFEKTSGASDPKTVTARNNLAALLARSGRLREAERLLKKTLAAVEKAFGQDHPYFARTLRSLATMAFQQHQWQEAANYARVSAGLALRRMRRGIDNPALAVTATSEDAVSDNRRSFEILIKTLYQLAPSAPEQAPLFVSESFEAAQWASGSQAAASLAQMSARQAKGDTELAALVRERQDLAAEWRRIDGAMISAASHETSARDPAAEQQSRTRLAAIDARMAEVDVTLVKRFPDYAGLASPGALADVDVQKLLRPNEVLLLYVDTHALAPLPDETFLWVVTPIGSRWVRLGLSFYEIAGRASALRDLLGVGSAVRAATIVEEGEAVEVFDLGLAHELYSQLLGPVADLIAGKNLIVIPSQSLTALPFHLLVSQPPDPSLQGFDGYQKASWLIRDHAISVLPSVSSLGVLRRAAAASGASKPYLGIGDPLLDGGESGDRRAWQAQSCQSPAPQLVAARTDGLRGISTYFRGGLADVAEVRSLPPLPETTAEVCAVARRLGSSEDSLLLGAKATETNLKRMSVEGTLADARVVHFATHGLIAGDLAGLAEPSLVLSPPDAASDSDDGLLTASEVATLRLDAEWVILSACNTAAGEGADAEALSGLARAFFYSGTRALLVSHWPVNSQAAVELTVGSINALATDPAIGRAEALRRSMLSLIAQGGEKALPAYWAPFVLVGEGAPR